MRPFAHLQRLSVSGPIDRVELAQGYGAAARTALGALPASTFTSTLDTFVRYVVERARSADHSAPLHK
jgi:hypothetical protein